MIKAGVINKYSQVCKKKERKKKEKTVLLFPPPQGFPTIYKQLIPVLYKCEDGGKQERRNEMTYMDLIRSNKKKACATGGFVVFNVLRFDQTA